MQINQANLDIIHTLKSYIAEKGLPDTEIINSIIASISRKYNVKESELFSIYEGTHINDIKNDVRNLEFTKLHNYDEERIFDIETFKASNEISIDKNKNIYIDNDMLLFFKEL